jgi:hypothetical protein
LRKAAARRGAENENMEQERPVKEKSGTAGGPAPDRVNQISAQA